MSSILPRTETPTTRPKRTQAEENAIARYAAATKAKDLGAKFGEAYDKAKQKRMETRAPMSDAAIKNFKAATAKKPAPTLAATVKAKPLTAATTKPATSATAKPASKSILSDAKRAELSANYKKNYAAAMAPFKDRIATKNAAKATATVKKATGGYVTKPTFKW